MRAETVLKLFLSDLLKREGLRITPHLIEDLEEHWSDILANADGDHDGEIE